MTLAESLLNKPPKTRPGDNVAYFLSDEVGDEISTGVGDAMAFTTEGSHIDRRTIGQILVDSRRLSAADAESVLELQRQEGLFFGEAAKKLRLVSEDDVQHALSKQFDYPYLRVAEGVFSNELVSAYKPFSPQSEALRGIRSALLQKLSERNRKAFTVISPGEQEGRSYLAANLAVTFSQMGKRTLLMDANLRKPRMHSIFEFPCRVGLSAMLAGRVKKDDLEHLPETVPFFSHLSVLGAGAIPPNPLELLAGDRLPRIISELSQHYDIIIIDTPAGQAQADFQPLSIAAGSALLVARKDHTKVAAGKRQTHVLQAAGVQILGAVLSQF